MICILFPKSLLVYRFPLHHWSWNFALKKLNCLSSEFLTVWILLITSQWCQLTCVSLLRVSCKLIVGSRDLTRCGFNFFGNRDGHIFFLEELHNFCLSFCNISNWWWSMINYQRLQNGDILIPLFLLHWWEKYWISKGKKNHLSFFLYPLVNIVVYISTPITIIQGWLRSEWKE